MALAKIKGRWVRVRTIENDPHSSSVTIRTGKTKQSNKVIPRSRFANNKNQIPFTERQKTRFRIKR